MATQLYAGTLAAFDGSMAKAIEDALATMLGPLPPGPPQLVADRRALFIGIARGVIGHLKENEAALQVTVNTGHGIVTAHPSIGVRS